MERVEREDFEKAIEELEALKPAGPPRMSFGGWTALIFLITDAITFAMNQLFDESGQRQRVNFWKKLKFGGYFIIFIVKVVKIFKG